MSVYKNGSASNEAFTRKFLVLVSCSSCALHSCGVNVMIYLLLFITLSVVELVWVYFLVAQGAEWSAWTVAVLATFNAVVTGMLAIHKTKQTKE